MVVDYAIVVCDYKSDRCEGFVLMYDHFGRYVFCVIGYDGSRQLDWCPQRPIPIGLTP